MMSRRMFLKNGGLALVSLGFAPEFLARTVAAAGAARQKVLIAIFQRGAVDGLNMIVPFGERDYYASRPSIAIPRPDGAPTGARSRRVLRPPPAPGAARSRSSTRVSSRSSMRAGRTTTRARTSTRRTTWRRHAGREEHAGRLAEPLPARAEHEAADAVPRRGARAAAAALAAGHAPALAIGQIDQFGIRAGQVDRHGRSPRSRRSTRRPPTACCTQTGREAFDADSHAQAGRSVALRAGQRRRVPALRVRRGAAADRAARSRPTSASRSRSPNPGNWDHHVNEGAAVGQIARPARRLRARHRGVRPRPRRPHGGRRRS